MKKLLGFLLFLGMMGATAHAQYMKPIVGMCQSPTGTFIPVLASTLGATPGAGYISQALLTGIASDGTNHILQCDANGNLVTSGGMQWPATPGVPVCTGTPCTAWGTTKAAPVGTIVGTSDTQSMTNKTVDSVTPTVFGYLDPTSSVQAQLNAKQASLGFTPMNTLNNLNDVSSAPAAVANLGSGYILFKMNTPATPVNGTTAETILYSHVIAAGVVGSNSNIDWNTSFLGDATVGTCTFRAYINSSNAIGGDLIFATSAVALGGRGVGVFGHITMANSQTSKLANANFVIQTNTAGNSLLNPSTISMASQAYFVVTAQPSSATSDGNGCGMFALSAVLWP